jgi:hypothetical protein
MDENQVVARIREAFSAGDVETFSRMQLQMFADDVVQEWPQSGERIRGRDNIAAVLENYEGSTGTSPKTSLRRILKPGEAWVIESTIDYGDGVPVGVVSIFETNADGKIVRETDYFANPFEAPEWRAKWVEKMEPITVG